jgi:hypothetical protein
LHFTYGAKSQEKTDTMNPELKEEIINYYFQRFDEKDFEISQVRRDLEKRNVEPEEIKSIVRIVDNELQRYIAFKSRKSKGNELAWVGLVLMTIGIGITFLTYSGIIDMGNQFLLSYGPFLGGLSMFFIGRSQRYRRSE